MKFRTIGSGSSGNCFLLNNDLLIDVGLSYKKLSAQINTHKIKHVLLTHKHGDHFNKPCVRKIMVNTKAIFYCGEFLEVDLYLMGVKKDRVLVLQENEASQVGDYTIAPLRLYHDVPNFGYRILYDGYKHIHCSDSSTLDGITAKNYDSASIEANHEEQKALKIIVEKKEAGEFCHLIGAMNSHLSVQQAIQFIITNNIKEFIPIHVGQSTYKEVWSFIENNKPPLSFRHN